MNEEEKKDEEKVISEDSDESPLNPTANEIEEKEVDWLCDGRFAKGFTTLVIGNSGVSKTFLFIKFAAHISSGEPWPDGSPCPEGKAILMNMVENDQNVITAPALRVAGANRENITIEGIFKETGEVFSIFEHENRLRAYLDQGGYEAWFLDILLDYTGGRVDFNKAQQVRPVMNFLNRIAAEYHLACLATLHFGKDFNKPAFLRYAGSHQIGAGAKVINLVGIDPDDPEPNPAEKRRFFMPDKQNLGGEWKKSWAFHMKKEGKTGCISWDEELEHNIDPNYVVSYTDISGGVLEAMKFLLHCLAEADDFSMYPNTVRSIGNNEGILPKDINTAVKRLKPYIIFGREGKFHAKAVWRLNLFNPKIYDILKKYEVDIQKTTKSETETDISEDAREKVDEIRKKHQTKEGEK